MRIKQNIWDVISDRAKREILCKIYIETVKATPGRNLDTIHGSVALLTFEGYSVTETADELNYTIEIINGALVDIENSVTK